MTVVQCDYPTVNCFLRGMLYPLDFISECSNVKELEQLEVGDFISFYLSNRYIYLEFLARLQSYQLFV